MAEHFKQVRIRDLKEKKQRGEKIAMLTVYDATMARLIDRAGIDVFLVGDSLGMVIEGHDTTIPVTLDAMLHHTRAVSRGTRRALVVADMPFLSYQVSTSEAVRNAGKLIQKGGAAAVKLEGGHAVAETVRRMVDAGIPVMGHVGLLPQHIHKLSGFRMQAKSEGGAKQLLDDARALEQAGAFSVVLESIPADVAKTVTEELQIPTIGIGAGPHCDGQVLVSYDAFGLNEESVPSFVKQYASLGELIVDAATRFGDDVRQGAFPECERSLSAALKRPRDQMTTRVIRSIAELRDALASIRELKQTVGLAPTMGALHAGHARLIETARRETDCVVASIFVNPIQFDRYDDYDRYPRDLSRDVEFCRVRGVDMIFAPPADEMYPEPQRAFVEVEAVSDHLCGKFRPGHFQGVATVVLKLLNMVQPSRAYFGEKDAQQLAVIRRMVKDLNLPVAIVEVPTMREADGLALSSRNQHLNPKERRIAPMLNQALRDAEKLISSGARRADEIKSAALGILQHYPEIRVEYLEIVDPEQMQPVEQITGPVRVMAAVWIGKTRLIDNVLCRHAAQAAGR